MSAPLRPHRSSKAVREEACRKLLPDYQRWAQRPAGVDTEADLRDLTRCAADDGYEFAKALDDRMRVDANAELVEILDSYVFHEHAAHEEAVKAWVAEHSIPTPFIIGQTVVHDQHGVGKVTGVRKELAAVIMVPHAERERFAGMEGCGILLPAESLRSVFEEKADG